MSVITLDKLCYRYPGASLDTLADIDLSVAQGEAHALLGASGAGKTTLLNLLSGLLSPTSGRVLFDGKDVSTRTGYARNVSQVFQFPVLYETLSVADNLLFPLRNASMSKANRQARIDYIAAEFALEGLLDKKPPQLSLFEKQLTAVAKALVRPDVSLVLLDEPLTAVEPQVKWRLRQVLKKTQADLGVTMIYVTHDQTEALTFANKVSVLTEHGILQTGTPTEIYQSPQHEFVGHFVGSPGMNFLPSETLNMSKGDTIGFRAEWLKLKDTGVHFTAVVSAKRDQGTQKGRPYVLLTLETPHGQVFFRGCADVAQGAKVGLYVTQFVLFKEQRQVDAGYI